MTTEQSTKTIAHKLSQVSRDCAYIEKKGTNVAQKYSYVTAADVIAKANESMARNGLVATTGFTLISQKSRITKTGSLERHAIVQAQMVITDMDDMRNTVTVTALGSGSDYGDKAIMKAQTAAMKYAWIAALNIATGDDPEADERTDTEARPAKRPAQALPGKPVPAPSPAYAPPPRDGILEWIKGKSCEHCGAALVRAATPKGIFLLCSVAHAKHIKGEITEKEYVLHHYERDLSKPSLFAPREIPKEPTP